MNDKQLDNILKKHFQNKIDNVSIRLKYDDVEKPNYYQKPQGIWYSLAYGFIVIAVFTMIMIGINTNARDNLLAISIEYKIKTGVFNEIVENAITIKESFENYMKNKAKNN